MTTKPIHLPDKKESEKIFPPAMPDTNPDAPKKQNEKVTGNRLNDQGSQPHPENPDSENGIGRN